MARPLRIQYPGAAYHVICRGDDRKKIFRDDSDRNRFLDILSQSKKTYSTTLYCYVLMDNHFHLFVETPLGNLSEFMRHLNITYTSHYNRRHKRTGHLFQGRYKSILVEKDAYAVMLSRYIHLNPVHTAQNERKASKEKERYLRSYPWSTLPGYIDEKMLSPLVDYQMTLNTYGGDNRAGRAAYWNAIREDLSHGIAMKDKIVAQSVLGTDAFIQGLMKADRMSMREVPSARKIKGYIAKEKILRIIEDECAMTIDDIRLSRGLVRRIVMELLYRYGGMKGTEIGLVFGVDYSTVSQARRRLRLNIEKDEDTQRFFGRIETKVSTIKI